MLLLKRSGETTFYANLARVLDRDINLFDRSQSSSETYQLTLYTSLNSSSPGFSLLMIEIN